MDFWLLVAKARCAFTHFLVMLGSLLFLLIMSNVVNAGGTAPPILAKKKELKDAYREAVVYLSTEAVDDSDTKAVITGSGFIISKQGHVITAGHVIPLICVNKGNKGNPPLPCYKKRGKIHVRLGSNKGPILQAELIQDLPPDYSVDLALLKIVNPPSNLKTVKIGNPLFVKPELDYLFLAGFPAPENFFIKEGELQDFESGQRGKSNRWVAYVDKTWGDSGGPVFWGGEVVAVLSEGNTSTQQNTLLAPIVLADKYLEGAGVWRPWKEGSEAVIEKLASRDQAVTISVRANEGKAISLANERELFEIRERQNNQEDSVREDRYRLVEVGSALKAMWANLGMQDRTQDIAEALDALNRGETEPARKLLVRIASMNTEKSGLAYYLLGYLAEINIDYESALSWYKRAVSEPTPKAFYYDAATVVAHKLGDQALALQWAKESIRLREGNGKSEDPGFADALCRLGEIILVSDPDVAIKNCSRALDILKQFRGQELLIAGVSDTLGVAYGFRGALEDFTKEEEFYRKALDISERVAALTKSLQAQKIYANSNNNLAGLYRRTGRHRDSLPLRIAAISMNEQILGKDHPRLGIDLAGLAIQKRALGDYAESQVLFEKARLLLTRAIGRKNRHVGVVLKEMTSLSLINAHDQEALDAATEALKMFEELYGKENCVYEVQIRMLLAESHSIKGNQADALKELNTAERIRDSKYSGRADLAFQILLLRAATLLKQANLDQAQAALAAANEVGKRFYSNDALWGEFYLINGKLHAERSEWDDAEKDFEGAQQRFAKSLGSEHPKRAAALSQLARVQLLTGNMDAGSSNEALAAHIASNRPARRVLTVVDL